MNKLIVLDIDGVLANFEDRLVHMLWQEFGSVALENRDCYKLEDRWGDRPEVLNKARQLTADPNIYYGLEMHDGADNFLATLVFDDHPFMFVTSRPEYMESVTRRWLNRKFRITNPRLYCGILDKAEFLSRIKDSIDFVIDDNPEIIKSLQDKGFVAVCWSQEWNMGIFPRLYVRSDGEVMLWSREDIEAEPFFEMAKEI